jgi:cephalosporin hydroxylase
MESITFNLYEPTELCMIMEKNKSDKGNSNIQIAWHNYTQIYTQLFKNLKPKRIFELGLGTNDLNISSNMGVNGRPGASHYGWSEYFPDAKVYGADIDYNCLFSTEKIKTFYCDQTNVSSIENLWKQYELQESFDIIIDDGAHTIESIIVFFENSIHKLQTGGYYIVEDIRNDHMDFWEQMIPQMRSKYLNFQFKMIKIPNILNTMDNNLIVIQKIN